MRKSHEYQTPVLVLATAPKQTPKPTTDDGLLRHGSCHDIYHKPETGRSQPIPRHRDTGRGAGERGLEMFEAAEEDESVIGRIVAAQREAAEREIAGLKAEAERIAEEARELAGRCRFEM